jgi:hypothetical protein
VGGFEVDLAGVREFGSGLRKDLDDNLWPQGASIATVFQEGMCFGWRSASPDVQAAAFEYHVRLNQALRLFDALLHNSEVMVQAASDVVRAYEQADSMSGTELQAVLDAAGGKVNAAADAASAARRAADQAAAAAEAEFLRERGFRL